MTKRILITGGAGFIGSHLAERLAADHTVVCVDNYFTGCKTNHVPGVAEYNHGGTYAANFIPKYEHYGFDLIFHLGEYSRVEQSFTDYKKVFKYNITGTKNVLELAKKTGAKLIYAGSSTKFTHEHEGFIQSPYAWSKKVNTELVVNYGKWFGLNHAITYFYNVYGGREISSGTYATLIGRYTEAMRQSETLKIVSPGTQVRNFTHVDDIIDALVLIGEHGKGDEYGIGSPEAYSVRDVAAMFGSRTEMLPERPGNRMSADVVTNKTRELGWNPKRSLPEYVANLKANNWR